MVITKKNVKDIGNRIKNIRLSKGLSVNGFGECIDEEQPISKSRVLKWEKGVDVPNKQRLKKISELGGVSVDYLLSGKTLNSNQIKLLKHLQAQGSSLFFFILTDIEQGNESVPDEIWEIYHNKLTTKQIFEVIHELTELYLKQ